MSTTTTSKPINWKRNLFFIWLGQILAVCGDSFALPFMPLYIRDNFGITDETLRGSIVAAYQFFGTMTFCISNPLWGMLGDRYGRKLMLLRAYFLNGITIPLMMFAPSWGWLIALRALVSCFSGTISASQTLMLATTPEDRHGFALGVLSSALWSGTVLGLLGGGIIVHYYSYRTAFFTCGAMLFFCGMLMLLFVRENFVRPEKRAADKALGTWLSWPILAPLIFIGAAALARRMDEPFLPILTELVGGVEKAALHTSFVSAAAAVGGIVSGMMFGALSDRLPAWKLTLPALLVAGTAMLLQSRTESLWMLGIWRFICYFAAGGIEPVFLRVLAQRVAPEHRGGALGLSASFRVGGGVAAAALSGIVVAHFQTRGVFFAAGLAMLLLMPLCWAVLHREISGAKNRS